MNDAVLVTGSRGFCGRHLVALLRGRGLRVLGFDLSPSEHPDDRAGDLCDPVGLGDVLRDAGVRRVFHLAGGVGEPRDAAGRQRLVRANILATMGLLEALSAVPAPPRTLVAGSASVYGIPVASDGVVRESDPVAPVLFYGMTKAAQEDVFRLWARWGRVQPIFARSFNLTGPGEGTGSLPGAIARQLAAGADPILVGNLAPVRDFLDVRDAVAAYDLLSQRGEPGAAYNVASGRGESVRDHVARLVVAAGGSSRVVVDPDRVKAVDVAEVVADVSRLRALGWVPGFAPERTARDLLAAVRGGEGPWI